MLKQIMIFSILLFNLFAYADTTRNIETAISADQTAAIVNYIAQGSSLGVTITNNIVLRGEFILDHSHRLVKLNVTALSFDAMFNGRTIKIPDSISMRLTADVSNGLCQNLTALLQSVSSTDSLVTQGIKTFLNTNLEYIVKNYFIAHTGLVQYCTDIPV